MLKLVGEVTGTCAMTEACDIERGTRARGHGGKGAVAITGSDSQVRHSQALAALASKAGGTRDKARHNSEATCGWVERRG